MGGGNRNDKQKGKSERRKGKDKGRKTRKSEKEETNENIFSFNIAMNDIKGMQMSQTFGNLDGKIEKIVELKRFIDRTVD